MKIYNSMENTTAVGQSLLNTYIIKIIIFFKITLINCTIKYDMNSLDSYMQSIDTGLNFGPLSLNQQSTLVRRS